MRPRKKIKRSHVHAVGGRWKLPQNHSFCFRPHSFCFRPTYNHLSLTHLRHLLKIDPLFPAPKAPKLLTKPLKFSTFVPINKIKILNNNLVNPKEICKFAAAIIRSPVLSRKTIIPLISWWSQLRTKFLILNYENPNHFTYVRHAGRARQNASSSLTKMETSSKSG